MSDFFARPYTRDLKQPRGAFIGGPGSIIGDLPHVPSRVIQTVQRQGWESYYDPCGLEDVFSTKCPSCKERLSYFPDYRVSEDSWALDMARIFFSHLKTCRPNEPEDNIILGQE